MSDNIDLSSMAPKLCDVFISYSGSDSEVATRLLEVLEQAGFVVWLDKREVLVGHDIVERVNWGISESRFMVLLLSNSSVESEWVKQEWTAARIAEIESKEVVILPALVEPCEIPALLKSKRYADLTSWDAGVADLIHAIGGHSSIMERHPQRSTRRRKAIIESQVHFPVYHRTSSLEEIFFGGVVFTGISKDRFRGMSLLIQLRGQTNVAVTLDDEDVAMLGGVRFEDRIEEQLRDQEWESIPCMVLQVDRLGEYSRLIRPTHYQLDLILGRGTREVIILFLIEDSTGSDIMGFRLGCLGSQPLQLTEAHVSFVV